MNVRLFFAALTCPALVACSAVGTETVIPDRGAVRSEQCMADDLEALLGQKATAEIGADALAKSGSRTLRWIPPNSAVTLDYRHDRLNIEYDDKMVIVRVNCG